MFVVVVVGLVVIVFDNDCVYVWCQGGDCCCNVEPLVVYIVDNEHDYNSILMNLYAVVDNYYYSHNSDNHDDDNDSQLNNFFHFVIVVVVKNDDNAVDNNIVVVIVNDYSNVIDVQHDNFDS